MHLAPPTPADLTSVPTHTSILPGSILHQGQSQGLPDKGKKDLLFESPTSLSLLQGNLSLSCGVGQAEFKCSSIITS